MLQIKKSTSFHNVLLLSITTGVQACINSLTCICVLQSSFCCYCVPGLVTKFCHCLSVLIFFFIQKKCILVQICHQFKINCFSEKNASFQRISSLHSRRLEINGHKKKCAPIYFLASAMQARKYPYQPYVGTLQNPRGLGVGGS